MAAIRSKNTYPEILVRRHLHKKGFRFRVHPELPGRPDIVMHKHNAVVWIHGCFWHGHDCPYFRLPKTRRKFWETKIQDNRERDIRALAAMKSAGWRQLIVWECSLRADRADTTLDKIEKWILSRRKLTEF